MEKKQEIFLLSVIKYSSPVIIFFSFIFFSYLLFQEYKELLKKEKKSIELQFMLEEKLRIKADINNIFNYLKITKENSTKVLEKQLKNEVYNAHKIASNIYDRNKKIKSREEIVSKIELTLGDIRFRGDRGYYAIHDISGQNMLHSIFPTKEDAKKSSLKSSPGKSIINEAINIVNTKKEGYLRYYFLNKDNKKEYKKIGYVKIFEPYKLILSTGEYIKDHKDHLKRNAISYIEKIKYKNNHSVLLMDYSKMNIANTIKDNDLKYNYTILLEKLIKENKKDDGFISYKLKNNEMKVLYAKKFDDWEWIIGTSFQLSDIQPFITERKKDYERIYSRYKNIITLYGLILIIVLTVFSYFISKIIEKKFLEYKLNIESKVIANAEQKDRLINAQKVAHVGDWILNLTTMEATWSEEILNIFGLERPPNNLGPEYFKNVIHKDDVQKVLSLLKECIENNIDYKIIYRMYRPNGELRWIDSRGTLDRKKNYLIGTAQDITETKILEFEIKESERILFQQSKLASMGEMLGNIAHQWRQPLSLISTVATGTKFEKEMNTLTDENLCKSMDSINTSTQYLSQTIEDFRCFFDPHNSKITKFNIRDTIEKTLKLINIQLVVKDINIIKEIDNYQLESSENELIQVLINILNNSRDILIYSEIKTKLIFIKTYKKDLNYYIEISDNGEGIDDSILDKIFDPYFTTKHKHHGTGIGLYMSQELIKKVFNGELTFKNEIYTYKDIEYTGAKFTIKLPAIDN
jgi:signal transduction histidine kinase